MSLPKNAKTPDPIMVPCEGSAEQGNKMRQTTRVYGCKMCGQWFMADDEGLIPEHERMDIIAMLDRGDFS